MRDALDDLVRRFLKVPAQPEPPAGDTGTLRVFRAARGYFNYRLLAWGVRQGSFLIGVALFLIFREFVPGQIGFWLNVAEGVAILFFVVQLPFSFLFLVLDYEYRWYMVTDRSLRIREGVFKVKELTMTFSNIQNVAIRQGPLQRLFGISDLEVRTAGGGSGEGPGNPQHAQGDNLHLGYFRGVSDAAEIRDAILADLRRLRSAGLGDPDDRKVSHEANDNSSMPDTAGSALGGTDAAAARDLTAKTGSSAEKESPPGMTSSNGDPLLVAGRQLLAEARALRSVASRSA